MPELLKKILAHLRREKPATVVAFVSNTFCRKLCDQLSLQTATELSDTFGRPIRLVHIPRDEGGWLRFIPGSTDSNLDPLDAENLGGITIYETSDPHAALKKELTGSAFKKTRLDLQGRRLRKIQLLHWLSVGYYEYVFYRHTFYCCTKSGQYFEAAFKLGDGVTSIADLECRVAVLNFLNSVGEAITAQATQPSAVTA